MTIVYILAGIMTLMQIYLAIAFIYTIRASEKQAKIFRQNLGVGDATTEGIVTKITGDDVLVTVKRNKRWLYPTEYSSKSILFIGKKKK